ncbi:Gfo/Idh/MocA family protein [Paenibacillus sp. CF384]|uniref:Gfo/Idh/MocA family protein n=1 Tax=Paenibacillus sp. CF384 TaxID=1884382 RepID=UPI0008987294|nr:Gfo/Idh/MocA family oxidoreductase [Paenibacillus sp. CF384]SDW08041.1 Predicted dehydrogenase [Paenibacillus sp. CF384]
MSGQLKAVVIGAGWAGEGHTRALQACGVDVVAIYARKQEVVDDVAQKLGIPNASVDWRQTLQSIKPDIVAIATPASLREEVVIVATELGCHLYCDKPLALGAEEAKRVLQMAEQAGVKHAYAATWLYHPEYTWFSELAKSGDIGAILEVECFCRMPRSEAIGPWTWWDSLETGGGFLNNALPHLLGIISAATSGIPIRATGEARVLRERAPYIVDLHDSRLAGARTPTAEEAENLEWRVCDADGAFTALFRLSSAEGTEIPVTILLNTGVGASDELPKITLYGESGTLTATGFFFTGGITVTRLHLGGEPEVLPIPQRLLDEFPSVGDPVQNMWCAHVRDFIADIKGEPHRPYLTFRDGYLYQAAIDIIRSGSGLGELKI